MKLLVVNYHYIGDPGMYPRGGVHPLSMEKFEQQLDVLSESFAFVSQQDLLDALSGKKQLPERSCLITFDDGLKSQTEAALPILRRKNIPGIFFVCGLPYAERRACIVHKIHWLRANIPAPEFVDELKKSIQDLGIRDFGSLRSPEIMAAAKEKYGMYDDDETSWVKYVLNNELDHEERSSVIDPIFARYFPDEGVFVDEWYMSREDIKLLGELGMLGLHTYRHMPLSGFSYTAISKDVAKNKSVIESIAGRPVTALSYPYGTKYDLDKETAQACQEAGITLAFTMERAINATLEHPLLLARIDSNDALSGKRPLISQKDGEFVFQPEMTGRRTLFVTE